MTSTEIRFHTVNILDGHSGTSGGKSYPLGLTLSHARWRDRGVQVHCAIHVRMT